ncbi:hypothetical protein PV11_02315 [Exophiala sideris]|uniref:Uncharacterized protein n=1 Tax=Exophiala sideris TaxID=1016849 RepID=A0A0D1YYW1_9EURO|nr:hypothetical protein PV11_02315 [Exophiala sideris]
MTGRLDKTVWIYKPSISSRKYSSSQTLHTYAFAQAIFIDLPLSLRSSHISSGQSLRDGSHITRKAHLTCTFTLTAHYARRCLPLHPLRPPHSIFRSCSGHDSQCRQYEFFIGGDYQFVDSH